MEQPLLHWFRHLQFAYHAFILSESPLLVHRLAMQYYYSRDHFRLFYEALDKGKGRRA
jgi:hypothetical protein